MPAGPEPIIATLSSFVFSIGVTFALPFLRSWSATKRWRERIERGSSTLPLSHSGSQGWVQTRPHTPAKGIALLTSSRASSYLLWAIKYKKSWPLIPAGQATWQGGQPPISTVSASGAILSPQSRALISMEWCSAGGKGARPIFRGSMLRKRWCIQVFPTMVMSRISVRLIPAIAEASSMIPLRPSMIALFIYSRPSELVMV